MAAYKFWKIEIEKSISSFININEIYFLSSFSGIIGRDEISKMGLTATASNQFSSEMGPMKICDGDVDSYYASKQLNEGEKIWIKFSFPNSVNIKKMIIDSARDKNNRPINFKIFVSNDDNEYICLTIVNNFVYEENGGARGSLKVGLSISGKLTSEDGVVPGLETLCFLWNEPYSYVAKIVPDANGDYRIGVVDDLEYMIVHRGANGLKPQVDGPIRPKEE